MPRDEAWDRMRDEVSCVDSTADVMRQAVNAIEVQDGSEAEGAGQYDRDYRLSEDRPSWHDPCPRSLLIFNRLLYPF
jgi:hypothetical protein